MFGFLIALISGALMSIQGVLNTGLTRQTGIWLSAGWVQISAFFTCVVLWLFSERTPISSTWTVIRSMDRLGPAKATLFIVVTQIIVAYLIELFGCFGVEKASFEWQKVIGALIAIGGIILFHC